ncbi:ABC transporter permease [Actinomadura sp. KC216]|nr:ABC transporter permease [Actinomadura sp. KC216]
MPARPRDGLARSRLVERSYGAVAVLLVLAAWETAARTELLPRRYFPPVSEVLAALAGDLGTASFWTAAGATLQGWAFGLALAVAIAVPLGLVLGASRTAYAAARGVIDSLRPIPSVALIPLAITVYGADLGGKVFLATFAATWPLLIQIIYGTRNVDPVARDTARVYALSPLARVRWLVLPSALPYVVTGLRLASATALILAVTAEIVMGAPGLGRAIELARSGGSADLMYARMIATGVLALVLNTVFTRTERAMVHWHPARRDAEPAT